MCIRDRDLTAGIVFRSEITEAVSSLSGLEGVFIPSNSDNPWPNITDDQVLANENNILDAILEDGSYDWVGNGDDISLDNIDPSNYFNLTLSPSYQKFIKDRLGLEIGADIYYNFSGNPFAQEVLDPQDASFLRTNTSFRELGARLKVSIIWNLTDGPLY